MKQRSTTVVKHLRRLSALALGSTFAWASLAAAADIETLNQVYGFYSKGSLRSACSMSQESKGLYHLFHLRKRFYGSDGLIGIIESAAAEMSIRFPNLDRLQVGDLSAEQGGFITGHASHQNGLDVDLAYYRNDHREQIDPIGQKGFDESFVFKGRVSPNFDVARNWEVIKLFYDSGRLNRIFVDEKIKEAICLYADSIGEIRTREETLKRLRPYPNHDDHMHVRITCPKESMKCESQEPIQDLGSGCFQTPRIDEQSVDLVRNESIPLGE